MARTGSSAHVAAVIVVEFGGRERGAAHAGLRGLGLRVARDRRTGAANALRQCVRIFHTHTVREAARPGSNRGHLQHTTIAAARVACWWAFTCRKELKADGLC